MSKSESKENDNDNENDNDDEDDGSKIEVFHFNNKKIKRNDDSSGGGDGGDGGISGMLGDGDSRDDIEDFPDDLEIPPLRALKTQPSHKYDQIAVIPTPEKLKEAMSIGSEDFAQPPASPQSSVKVLWQQRSNIHNTNTTTNDEWVIEQNYVDQLDLWAYEHSWTLITEYDSRSRRPTNDPLFASGGWWMYCVYCVYCVVCVVVICVCVCVYGCVCMCCIWERVVGILLWVF